jgi:hypothetical protein
MKRMIIDSYLKVINSHLWSLVVIYCPYSSIFIWWISAPNMKLQRSLRTSLQHYNTFD